MNYFGPPALPKVPGLDFVGTVAEADADSKVNPLSLSPTWRLQLISTRTLEGSKPEIRVRQ